MAAKSERLQNIHYVREWTGFKWRRRKPTLDELGAYRVVLNRSQAASDQIREGAGLAPVPANFVRRALAQVLAERQAAPAPRKRAANGNGNGKPADPLEAVGAAVRARERAQKAVTRAVGDARLGGVSVTAIAGELGISRQALYAQFNAGKQ